MSQSQLDEKKVTGRGGKRDGAGRKKSVPDSEKSKSRTISLTDADHAIFMSLGGSKWLSKILKMHKK